MNNHTKVDWIAQGLRCYLELEHYPGSPFPLTHLRNEYTDLLEKHQKRRKLTTYREFLRGYLEGRIQFEPDFKNTGDRPK